jgi:hypothetical protein
VILTILVSTRSLAVASLGLTCSLIAACGAATSPKKLPCTGDSCDIGTDDTPQGFCVRDVECAADERCVGGACTTDVTEPTLTCTTTPDCAAGMYCETQSSRCVECLRDVHCDEGLTCRADFTCGPATGCMSEAACGALVCNIANGGCVECVTTNDCGLGLVCQNAQCIDPQVVPPECSTQADCDLQGKICDAGGSCVPCTSGAQCGTGKVCSYGTCTPDAGNVRSPATGELVVNEILADPPPDTAGTTPVEGDANGDGVRDTFNDEFIELVNTTSTTLDLTGCTLTVKTTLRHRFDPSADPLGNLVAARSALVVFGGGNPTGSFGGARTITSSTGSLTLANDGGSVSLDCPAASGSLQVDSVTYPAGGNDQSWTRAIDGDRTTTLVKHLVQVPGVPYSPGTCADGGSFASCL